MPLSDQSRILQDRLTPRILMLWQALAPLQSVVSFMNTGAHPDDETSAMLAALGLRDGLDLSYCCSTRGEGGQNDIGLESGPALGMLRTAEMERACDILNMRMYWLSSHWNDPVTDFGFSKSGVETLEKWGKARTLRRFARVLRIERPDIICPTFLDIPGQHGHHRAMTEAAHLMMDLAADPEFDTGGHAPWAVKKLYLPAWSGAGQAYDDDLPPPPATLTIQADGIDPISGASFERIGQQSRAFHKTQGMGSWIDIGAERNWPLHLAKSRVAGPDETITAGLPQTLRDLGFGAIQDHLDAARAAFPDFAAITKDASAALALLQAAKVAPEDQHRIDRKITQVSRVIRLAAGVQVEARLAQDSLAPGERSDVHIARRQGAATEVSTRIETATGWTADKTELRNETAEPSQPYPWCYLPDSPAAPCVEVAVTTHGVTSTSAVPFESPPLSLPAVVVDLSPSVDVVNLKSDRRRVAVALRVVTPSGGQATLQLPHGWTAERTETGFDIHLPAEAATGAYSIPVLVGDQVAQQVVTTQYDHVASRVLAQDAVIQLQVIEADLPKARVGYIGGGNDEVDHWLATMGLDVVALQDDDLTSSARLAQFDTLVIGIFAFKFRPALAGITPQLHHWVENGGNLVTLYHRPWDNWQPDATPPKPLEIGQPSLRWRVTNEAAEVKQLAEHALLSQPNDIGPAEWQGWHKERGLYFAKSWDSAYTPLLEMADPDEAPMQGALLVADIGKGRHTHCALILHHQMAKGVPGAFRLMANLVAPRG